MEWTTRLLAQLLPSPCLLCDGSLPAHSQMLLCPSCQQALPTLEGTICRCCSLPLNSEASFCGECIAQPPAFTASLIPFRYDFPLSALIRRFKYQGSLSAGNSLGQLLLEHVQQHCTAPPQLLIPVPLHWRKHWQRGFNQAMFTAQYLGKQLGIPVVKACYRREHSHSQQGLSRHDRLRNLRRAFALRLGLQGFIHNKHVALVDDVVTTGATARSLGELLLKAGAARVDIWALARTPSMNDQAAMT